MDSGAEKPVTDQQSSIERNAAKARRALADPSVRAALLALLGGDDRSRRRERRIAAVRLELAGLEVRWPLLEEDERHPDVIFAIVVGVLAALGSGSRLARRAQV